MNVTYGTYPTATEEQQKDLRDLTEQFVLIFCAICVFKGDFASSTEALSKLTSASGLAVRPVLIDCLQSAGPAEDLYTDFANLVHICTQGTSEAPGGSPRQVFELAFKVLQMAQQTRNYKLVIEVLLPWLVQRWGFVWENQRFRLNRPSLYEVGIKTAMENKDASNETKVVEILSAILPTLGIGNQSDLERILSALPR